MPVDNRHTSALTSLGIIATPAAGPVRIQADRDNLVVGQMFDNKAIRCGGGEALVTGIFASMA